MMLLRLKDTMTAITKSRLIRIFLVLLGIMVAGLASAHILLGRPAVRNYLTQEIAHLLGLDLSLGQIGLDLNQGLGVKARDVRVRLSGGRGELHIPSLSLGFRLSMLLRGKISPKRVFLHAPRLELEASLPAAPSSGPPAAEPGAGTVLAAQGLLHRLPVSLQQVRITSGFLSYDPLPFEVRQLDLDLQIPSTHQRIIRTRIACELKGASGTARLELAGALHPGESIGDTSLDDLRLDLDQMPLAWIPWPDYLPCETGRAGGHLTFSGPLGGEIRARGNLTVDDLRLKLQLKGRHHYWQVAHLPLEVKTTWEAGRWHIVTHCPQPEILPVDVDWHWDFTTTPSPAMDLKVSGGPMPLAKFKALYPTPVTTPWLDRQLFPALQAGTVDLREFRLYGRLDQLAQLGRPVHRDRLKLDLDVKQTSVFSDRPGLPLKDVAAHVLIAGGALSITRLTGGFGDSKIQRADFGISDLYSSPLMLQGTLDGLFQLEDLKNQTPAPWFSEPGRNIFKPLAAATGMLKASAGFKIACINPPQTRFWGTFDLGSSRLKLAALEAPLDLEAGRMVLDDAGGAVFEAQGRWAESEFNIDGTGNIQLVGPAADAFSGWQAHVQGIFDLPGLLRGRNRELVKTRWPDFNEELAVMAGQVAADFKITAENPARGPYLSEGSFTLHDGCLEWPGSPWPVEVDSGELTWTADNRGRLSGTGNWGAAQWSAQGSLTGAGTGAGPSLRLDISGQWDPKKLADVLPAGIALGVAGPAALATRITLGNSAEGLSLAGYTDLAGALLDYRGLKAQFADPQARVQFECQRTSAGEYRFPRITIRNGSSRLALNGWMVTRGAEPRGSLSVSADTLHFEDFQLRLDRLEEPLKGRLQSSTTWLLDAQGLHPADAGGYLRVTDLGLSLPWIPAPVQDGDLDLRISPEGLRLASGHIKLASSAFDLEGRFNHGSPLKGSLRVEADQVRLRDLYRPAPAEKKAAADSPPPAHRLPAWLAGSDVQVSCAIQTLLGEKITSGPLALDLSLNNDILVLDALRLGLRPGVLTLGGRIPDAGGENMQFNGYLRTEMFPASDLMPLFGLQPDRLDAKLNLEGSYIARGRNKKALIGGLDGNFSVELAEGTFNESTVFFRVLDLLSLRNLVLERESSAGRDAFYIEKISADVEVRKGVAATDNFNMQSPAFNAAGRGSADLARRTVDFDLGAQPLGSVDNLVSRIPIVGHILTGPEKALLVYYFRITGPWEQPRVKHVPFKNLGKGLVGYFQRIFTTPPRLLRKAGEFTRYFQGLNGAAILPAEKSSDAPELPRRRND